MPVVIDDLAKIGGLFSIFVIFHFIADWVFQTHHEAINKTKNWKIRVRHCTIYTVLMLGALYATCYITALEFLLYGIILFASHFLEDSYVPVFYWAKYFRQEPELNATKNNTWSDEEKTPTNNLVNFKLFASQPIGLILLIVIDQIIHLLFLLPISQMILLHRQLILTCEFWTVFIITCAGLIILALLNLIGYKQLKQ